MKKLINKNRQNIIDYCVIGFAILTLVCNFFPTKYEHLNYFLCLIAGAIGVRYIVTPIWMLFFNRPKFDWHLVNGNYLAKVVALVLLFPSIITSGFIIYNHCFDKYSPKNLVFDDNLYSYEKSDSICLGNIRSEIFADTVYLKAHDLYVKSDTMVMQKNKLPDAITSKQEDPSIFWTVYYHFIDPGNQHMTTSKSGRGWSALIAIFGVFLLNGLLVSSIIGWIDSRKEKWLKGEVRYSGFLKLKKHYVVIGGNDVITGIVRQFISKNKYILIQTSRDVESFRRELFSNLTEEQQKLIIIYYGNRTSKEDIEKLHIEKAEEVYIIGEDIRADDIESYHDTINMKCLKIINDNIEDVKRYNKENPLICRVMFEYQTSFNILQVTDIDGKKIDFKPFNYYETWAQNVLICQELEKEENCEYLPLEGFDGIQAGQDKFVHFIVVGMSRMGLAMAIEAAHLAHYPNFSTNKKRTRITFIDASMEQEKHFFMSRFKEMFSLACYRDITYATEDIYNDLEKYPWVNPIEEVSCKSPYYKNDYLGKDFIDIEWEFINGSIENPNIQQYLADSATNADAKLTIAICLPDNSQAIAAATYLPDNVYHSSSTLQVLVYQRLNSDLLFQINQNKRYNNKLKAFGMNSLCYNSGLVELSEFIANKVNYAYDQYAWERIKMRYKGKGLIDDDYDSLSNYLYSDTRISSSNKKYIREECEKWMDSNNNEGSYQIISEKLKNFQIDLGRYISKQNNQSEGKSGKSKSAKMWSNKYNVYSMWTKFRCFGVNPTKPQDFEDRTVIMSDLGKMEHNRWIVEQLLLRFRPLMKEEQDKAQITNLYSSTKQKGIYKKEYAHLDICSNDKLNDIDYNMTELDQALVKVLPGAYREYLEEKAKPCQTNK